MLLSPGLGIEASGNASERLTQPIGRLTILQRLRKGAVPSAL